MIVPRRPHVTFFVTVDWYFCHHYLALAQAVREAGYEVSVVTRVDEHGDRIREAGLGLVPFEVSRKGMNPLRELAAIGRLVRVLRDLRPALLHNIAQKPVVYGTLAARLAGVPAVVNAVAGMGHLYTSNGLRARVVRGLLAGAYRALLTARNVRVLVQNMDDRSQIFGLTGVEPILIPGSGVDVSRYIPREQSPEPVVVVLASRMLWDKGIAEFVAAAQEIKSNGSHTRFALVGKPDAGNPSSVAEEQLRSWQQEGCIEWWGYRPDMPRVLAQAHIGCLPSYYREGLPKFLIEAAAAGLPLVTTDAPGCREVVTHGENGYLVPPRDSSALAAALNRLIQDQALRRRFGAKSRARAEAIFANERVFAQVLRVYEDLLSKP